jgi:hypothetical protein
MPEGDPLTAALKVLRKGGVVEFMFCAGGVSVEMSGTNSRVVYESRRLIRFGGEGNIGHVG